MIKKFMEKMSCNSSAFLSCLTIHLVIIGMLLTPIYTQLDKVDKKIEKIYEYIINGSRIRDIASAHPSALTLAYQRAQWRATP